MKNFNKKIKRFILFCVIFVMFSSSTLFANMPVIDIANLMNAIEQLYTTYQQITNTIEQVTNSYQQIQQQVQQMAKFDWSEMGSNFSENMSEIWTYGDFSWEDPIQSITKVKQSADEITRLVNSNMNRVNAVSSLLHDDIFSFGFGSDTTVSIADLCGLGDESSEGGNIVDFFNSATDYTKEKAKKVADGYAGKLTWEQRQAIMEKYGMSAENYAQITVANSMLNDLITEGNVAGTTEAIKAEWNAAIANGEAMKAIAQELPEGSVYAQAELTNNYLAQNVVAIDKLGVGLNKIWSFFTQSEHAKNVEEAIEIEKKQNNETAQNVADNKAGVDIYD